MADQSSPQTNRTSPAAAPLYEGSYVKGIATSLAFQAMVFFAGGIIYSWDEISPGASEQWIDRRRFVGYLMLLLWGFTQWALVLPMVWKWNRSGQTRSVNGMCATSIVGAIPSCLAVAACLFEVVVVSYEKVQRWIAK